MEFGDYKDGLPHGMFVHWDEQGQKIEEGKYKSGQRDGLYTFWYGNGQKHQERNYVDGVWVGPTTVWYENGQKKKAGVNKAGKEHGKWTYWYRNGVKSKVVDFKYGKIDGDIVAFTKTGEEDDRQTYSNDRLQDEWSYEYDYHDNGELKTKRSFNNGVEGGLWTTWFDNGQKKEEGQWENNQYMLLNRWNKNGKFLVKDGNGGWVSNNEDGSKKRKQMYEAGLLTVDLSFVREHYEDGQLKSEKSYEDNNPDGDWFTWHPNGQMQEQGLWRNDEYFLINRWSSTGKFLVENGDGGWVSKTADGRKKWKKIYKDGQLAGKWTYMYTEYESGKIKSEVSYKNGIRDGAWMVWHENGQKKEGGLIRDGVETGDWTSWDEDGNITEIKKYDSN
jgi:antitoxin component YwqK of YwqJK toxin-antitoxin module